MKALSAKAQRSEVASRTGRLSPVNRRLQTAAPLLLRVSALESGNGRAQVRTLNSPPSAVPSTLRSSATEDGLRRTGQPSTLNSRLARINDWPERAREAKYSVAALAKASGVCVRTLQSFFSSALGEPPRRCFSRWRMERAMELLSEGSNVSETADQLGYQEHSHFSREFKRYYGVPPRQHAKVSCEAV